MALLAGQELKASFKVFADSGKIDVLLVNSSTFSVEASLKSTSLESVLSTPARRNLFYDERVTLHVILRTSCGLDLVSGLLPSLDLSIATHATDAVPDGRGNAASASGKHDLTTTELVASHDHQWIEIADQNFIVWKPIVTVPRPRVRLQRPAVYFTASLAPRKAALQKPAEKAEKSTLTSYEPLPANVLEPLSFDPSLSGKTVYLSETKITKVAPPAPAVDVQSRPLRGATKRAFPIVPALYTKLRCSPAGDAVIISLHVEIAQLMSKPVLIQSASIHVQGGHVESISNSTWPIESHGGDEDVFLFRAAPIDQRQNKAYIADLHINSTFEVEPDCRSQLDVSWQSQIDFSQVAKHPEYKWSRPLSTQSQNQRLSAQSHRPPSTDGHLHAQAGAGIIFNFVVPQKVSHRCEFPISIQCINKSNRTRRFAIISIQLKKLQHMNSRSSSTGEGLSGAIAKLLTSPPADRLQPFDVLDVTPETRIGPLPAEACYETRWTFRAMEKGVLDLGILRIVDLDSMRTVDVKELPTIMSVDDAQTNAIEDQSEVSLYKVHTPYEWTKTAPSFAVTMVEHRGKQNISRSNFRS
ncbi:hypothetical protein K431DRAFT_315497 [Polychaeton citri CBS 116435]|uniref:Trafficking protein particle complex II-specific subunit 65 IgD3 domain-containing protein n=1 Tax=Polychaeton citri CBS 116435 TaxID=1314669 RepID=A0A9P4Q1M2_9PEZI|nr:hypothetical protein K431DRAFT_315497 [Polychaeton citri CBS 116435]